MISHFMCELQRMFIVATSIAKMSLCIISSTRVQKKEKQEKRVPIAVLILDKRELS